MTIQKIIEKHYNTLLNMLYDPFRMVSEGKTDLDYLNDVCLTALKKFKQKDITEEEGFEYIKKNVLMLLKFKYKRKNPNILYSEECITEISNI